MSAECQLCFPLRAIDSAGRTHISMIMGQRNPRLPFLSPQRRKKTCTSPSVAQSPSSRLDRRRRPLCALLDRDLYSFRLLLLDLGVGEVPLGFLVVAFLVALATAFEGDEVVEIGEGGAKLISLCYGGQVQGVCSNRRSEISSSPREKLRTKRRRTIFDDSNEVVGDVGYRAGAVSDMIQPPPFLLFLLPELLLLLLMQLLLGLLPLLARAIILLVLIQHALSK